MLIGLADAVVGLAEASPLEPVTLGADAEGFPAAVASAMQALLRAGIGGPYGLALGDEDHRAAVAATQDGYPILRHLEQIVDGPIVWTPGIVGGVLLSRRGGDFELTSGQDIAIGYDTHDAETVGLYLQESFTFHVVTPDAAVRLV